MGMKENVILCMGIVVLHNQIHIPQAQSPHAHTHFIFTLRHRDVLQNHTKVLLQSLIFSCYIKIMLS